MFSSEKKSGGDFVLESRHLVGLFMLLVVIFGVVFTLGYLMGRSQYDAGLRAVVGAPAEAGPPAAASALKSKAKSERQENANSAPSQKNSDWDFYRSAEPKTAEDHLQPAKKTVAAPPPAAPKPAAAPSKPASPPKNPAPAGAPLVANGAIMLQVAAVQRESDAMALAQALQQKKFPAYVITPSADKYYRVQVGPYADTQSASNARHDLEADGFKSIVKR
jgi:cell division septation protein DedD